LCSHWPPRLPGSVLGVGLSRRRCTRREDLRLIAVMLRYERIVMQRKLQVSTAAAFELVEHLLRCASQFVHSRVEGKILRHSRWLLLVLPGYPVLPSILRA